MGCIFQQIKIERRGSKILSEIITLFNIYKIIKNIRPDILLNFTIKPIIYGSLVTRILNIKTLNTLDGIGATFEISKLKNIILKFLIKLSQEKVDYFYFVNLSDQNFFVKKKFILRTKTKLIYGTGIDLEYFRFKENIIKKRNIFLLISRLLYSKGVINYLDTAISISKKFKKKVYFMLLEKLIKISRTQFHYQNLKNTKITRKLKYITT